VLHFPESYGGELLQTPTTASSLYSLTERTINLLGGGVNQGESRSAGEGELFAGSHLRVTNRSLPVDSVNSANKIEMAIST
jgi:hypothetical protein